GGAFLSPSTDVGMARQRSSGQVGQQGRPYLPHGTDDSMAAGSAMRPCVPARRCCMRPSSAAASPRNSMSITALLMPATSSPGAAPCWASASSTPGLTRPRAGGKLERLNRVIRERFLLEAEQVGIATLEQLNDRFLAWV